MEMELIEKKITEMEIRIQKLTQANDADNKRIRELQYSFKIIIQEKDNRIKELETEIAELILDKQILISKS